MLSHAAVRALALYLPLAATAGLWALRRPPVRERTGVLLAIAWNLCFLPAVNLAAPRLGWWSFSADGPAFLGAPVELYLGWALLWGGAAPLAFRRTHVALAAVAAVCMDVLLMPLCSPTLVLGHGWLVGEAAALALCFAPALLLARWTARDRRLAWRAAMQAALAGALVMGIIPAVTFAQVGGGWTALLSRPFRWTQVMAQILALAALPGLSAVQELAGRGGGTPLPFDPPRRLVRSGPYAYVANPMQLSAALVMAVWGWMLHSGWLAAGAAMTVVYSAGLAAWDEAADLDARFGEPWREYRRAVRPWLPRLRPYWPTDGEPARLYVAAGCGTCSQLGRWMKGAGAVGLEVVPAETHPAQDLRRVSYDPRDGGAEEEGVAALGRALEHLHLGWALAGMAIRLPVVRPFAQLLADAGGGAPRRIVRWTSAPDPGCSLAEAAERGEGARGRTG
ncbi:MAG: hypothetical protein JWM27_964 [Gemmatimonadetes bacterium]|nr:hypothetical protein [Gemmatimonadota bacterium]